MEYYCDVTGCYLFEDGRLKERLTLECDTGGEVEAAEQLIREVETKRVEKSSYSLGLQVRSREYFEELRRVCMAAVGKAIRDAVQADVLMVQTVQNSEELVRVCNVLCRRLREWYGFYFPELGRDVADNEAFVRIVLEKPRDVLMKEYNLKESLGGSFREEDLAPMLSLANRIHGLYGMREELMVYLERMMEKECPNMLAVAGAGIGGKVLEEAGSLKRLAMMSSSTIQLLGAEQALFRHLKTGARCPKYGHIINHPLVAKAERSKKGKTARMLANVMMKAARLDYFKGEFQGDVLLKELEEKLG